MVQEVSYPDSPKYGQYTSFEEAGKLSCPKRTNLQKILFWFALHKIPHYQLSKHQDFLSINTTVSVAEGLLETEFFEYTHPHSRVTFHRAESYTVPKEVSEGLYFVGGVKRLPSESSWKPIFPFFNFDDSF